MFVRICPFNYARMYSRLRRGYSLVNMEDRMLDRFADHQS